MANLIVANFDEETYQLCAEIDQDAELKQGGWVALPTSTPGAWY